jgi:uncharacterized protein (TIGR03066 family)
MTKRSTSVAAWALALLALAPSALWAADTKKPAELIVGKWEGTRKIGDRDVKMTVQFKKDGMLEVALGESVLKGTWKLLPDGMLQLSLTRGADTVTNKVKVAVSESELDLTDSAGKTDKFKRAK